ncbi:MAG TPA: Holliday junction branch migration protein RuvA [Bacteroidota bacterium]|nr:Holliday junction branch migration protein RuvA [Bacteroidota bacterium]
MLSHLKGILHHKSPTEIVVDVNGVGYAVSIPLSTFENLGDTGSAVTVLIHVHVREDVFQLYGFATEAEREIFRLLISVSGIGPKIAQGILSGIQPDGLRILISQGNVAALTAVPGIGKKTAERLILELREKITRIAPEQGVSSGADGNHDIRAEALMALISLGYNRAAAENAIRSALLSLNGKDVSIQELLKQALKSAGR